MTRTQYGRFPWALWLVVLSVAALLFCSLPVHAETLQVKNPGTGSVVLDGNWRFHLGDDPAWADPSLDDSGWESIRVDAPWGAQTHPSYTGFAWYRQRIEIDNASSTDTKKLSLLIPAIQDAYEIFWNGQKLGTYGSLPPHADWFAFGHGRIYPLPTTGGVVALRVWKAPLSSIDSAELGGFPAAPLLGDAAVLAAHAQLRQFGSDERRLPTFLISAVALVIGMLSFLLYLRDRKEGLYLWLALYLVASGVLGLRPLSIFQQGYTYKNFQLITQVLLSAGDISVWLILLALFGMTREPRWRRATQWLVILYLAAQFVDIATIFFWQRGGVLPWIDGISTAVYSITPLYVFVIIGVGLMRRNRPSLWPLIVAVCLSALYNGLTSVVSQGTRFTHWTLNDRLTNLGFHVGSYFFGSNFVLNTLLFLALIFTIAREQFLERARQAKIEMEIKSAQEVQRILIPEEAPAIAGLSIASVYRPAEEVGGDFFQVVAMEGGGALLALGDVSGKGLKAAMTVSLIVGTLRTLADYTQSPAAILEGLNRRLQGRTDGGFATCTVARIDPNGETTLSHAGHLPPYRDREELPVTGSLPLGLTLDALYDELSFVLHEGETLTFYTDGILEARNAQGELYGFERLGALIRSDPSIEQMVQTACDFGQEDDITIFRVTRLAKTAPANAARMSMATQIAGVQG